MSDWNGRSVLILGAARQGVALARWLHERGARVTLTDTRPELELGDAQAALSGLGIRWAAGGHPLSLLEGMDLLCLSGGVPTTIPIVQEALRRGIPLSNDTQIFLEVAPCRTIGITGSAGKTTTTALVGHMAQAAFADNAGDESPRAFVGGNIGDPLLNHVEEMKAKDLAILEISSFQLEQMSVSPNVAAILNVTPNHLDRHGTMEAYSSAKQRILDFQSADDSAVLSRDDPGAWGLRSAVRGELHTFGMGHFAGPGDGTYYEGSIFYLFDRGVDIPLLRREQIQMRGDHNVQNVLAAFAIGHASGLALDAMLNAAEDFHGVKHRLELVREADGVDWYDDSIATTPERVAAAIQAFDESIVLLLGGRDKDLPWENLAQLVCQRVDHVVLFGEAAGMIQTALIAAGAKPQQSGERPYSLETVRTLHQAVRRAGDLAESGDVILLSPGGTSFDEFKDFEERGERFRTWAQELS